jgi:hypothetical protein
MRQTRSQTRGLSLSGVLQHRSESASGDAAAKRQSSGSPSPSLPDVDAIDRDNPLAATEYVNDIYAYYRRVEPRFRVAHDYMRSQVGRAHACDRAGTRMHGRALPRTRLSHKQAGIGRQGRSS